jgi:hypothetical protein
MESSAWEVRARLGPPSVPASNSVNIVKKLFLFSGVFIVLIASFACSTRKAEISGTVLDENHRPLTGATVRVKATTFETVTDPDGRFVLTGLVPAQPVFVTAWAPGYYINGLEAVLPGSSDVEIALHAHHSGDNPDYAWLPSTYHAGQGENQGCAQCHSTADSPPSQTGVTLPVDEWLLDAHAQSANNPRFLSMYTGTDLLGDRSPDTRYAYSRDYGRFPLPPDPDQPYYGPGYKLDFPETAGNCAACHTPAAAVNDPYGVDPSAFSGLPAEGISCDFCHKVWDVRLDPKSGLPYPNMPGVLSFEFRRPPDGHQFFAGPLDDVAPGEDTYAPVQRQSQYCAACHFGEFWGTTIYNSFGEWLASPYSDPETGQTCQDCHMPHLGTDHFALPDQGGVARDPQTIFSHRMPGASDETLLQNAVKLEASARREGNQVVVDVTLTNDRTGHHVPTDSPLRQMLLLVQAQGSDGAVLELIEGPVLPEWVGVGDPQEGYYAGLPGVGYAKILMEIWTGVSPTGAYWNPTRVVSDNRLPASGSDSSRYTFTAPADGAATVKVTLLFRRAFITLAEQKGWDVPDILMAQTTLSVP